MGKLAKAIQELIKNSDDLSSLPQIAAQVEEIENQDDFYQERIQKLQEINRNYLAQIPIPGQEQTQEPEGEPEATLEDAKEHIINSMGGNK